MNTFKFKSSLLQIITLHTIFNCALNFGGELHAREETEVNGIPLVISFTLLILNFVWSSLDMKKVWAYFPIRLAFKINCFVAI